jgi:hypothetical protein
LKTEETNFLSSETDATISFAVNQKKTEKVPEFRLQSFWDDMSDQLSDEGLEDALALVQDLVKKRGGPILLDADCYVFILRELAKSGHASAPDLADKFLSHMTQCSEADDSLAPTAVVCNIVVSIWSESFRKGAEKKCCEYLDSLWSLHVQTKDSRFVPLRSSYISTITALSRTRNQEGAEQAEQLLKDMTRLRQQYPELSPNTICVNGVL